MRRAVVLVLFAVGCTTMDAPDPTANIAAARTAIEALDAQAQHWMATGAVDSLVAGYYTADAVVMNPNQPPLIGAEAIRNSWNEMSKSALVRVELKLSRIYVADSMATTQGSYTFRLRPKPPADTSNFMVSDRGNYVTTYLKRNGEWRAVLDIVTSEMPLPSAALPGK